MSYTFQLPDKSWSQVSSVLPLGSCLHEQQEEEEDTGNRPVGRIEQEEKESDREERTRGSYVTIYICRFSDLPNEESAHHK